MKSVCGVLGVCCGDMRRGVRDCVSACEGDGGWVWGGVVVYSVGPWVGAGSLCGHAGGFLCPLVRSGGLGGCVIALWGGKVYVPLSSLFA